MLPLNSVRFGVGILWNALCQDNDNTYVEFCGTLYAKITTTRMYVNLFVPRSIGTVPDFEGKVGLGASQVTVIGDGLYRLIALCTDPVVIMCHGVVQRGRSPFVRIALPSSLMLWLKVVPSDGIGILPLICAWPPRDCTI
jgi:hypothetical protein